MPKPRRAPPLDREARRAAIIAAVVPLLTQRGTAVTTREMAEAAGVAEGTLFTVFEDKRALVLAAIEDRMNATPLRCELAALGDELVLERKLLAAAAVIMPRLDEVRALASALHSLPAPGKSAPKHHPGYFEAWNAAINDGLAALLEPHAQQLRLAPERVAHLFAALLFSSRAPYLPSGERLAPAELVGVLLHGTEARTIEERR